MSEPGQSRKLLHLCLVLHLCYPSANSEALDWKCLLLTVLGHPRPKGRTPTGLLLEVLLSKSSPPFRWLTDLLGEQGLDRRQISAIVISFQAVLLLTCKTKHGTFLALPEPRWAKKSWPQDRGCSYSNSKVTCTLPELTVAACSL